MKEEIRKILKERAMAMAREPEFKRDTAAVIEVITFGMGGRTYGIESSYVREVSALKDYTILPGVPSYVSGIINFRGKIMPIINIKKFFNIHETGMGELNRVLIVENENMEFGILADLVGNTQSVRLEDIHAVPLTITGIGAEYLIGVTKENLIMLNAEKLLSDKSIIVNDEIK